VNGKPFIVVAVAASGIFAARQMRIMANEHRVSSAVASAPFAPSKSAAPFVSLGYREVNETANLVEAVTALDPRYLRAYEFGARAITLADSGLSNETYLRAIAVLQTGSKEFPKNWKLPYLASQIYLQDLQTENKDERRKWDEDGMLLAESALRKPGAPAEAAAMIAVMRTKLGQQERATRELREMLLVTDDKAARRDLIARLAKLEGGNAEDIASEISFARAAFELRWQASRPALPASMYVVLGDPKSSVFDLSSLASGGDTVFQQQFERLPPVE
jgi:hypothetical protein